MDKDVLIQEVWPDTFVEENSLTRNISVSAADARVAANGHAAHRNGGQTRLPARGCRDAVHASARHCRQRAERSGHIAASAARDGAGGGCVSRMDGFAPRAGRDRSSPSWRHRSPSSSFRPGGDCLPAERFDDACRQPPSQGDLAVLPLQVLTPIGPGARLLADWHSRLHHHEARRHPQPSPEADKRGAPLRRRPSTSRRGPRNCVSITC